MNTFKTELNKIILALTSVEIVILLIFPGSLSADHFRYGTMSWILQWDNGSIVDNDTITFNQSNAWTNTNAGYDEVSDFAVRPISGFIGSVKDYQNLSLNFAELRRYIEQQKQIIVYYEKAVAPVPEKVKLKEEKNGKVQ